MIMVTMLAMNVFSQAPQKFAVLIGGDPNGTNVPLTEQWNQGQNMGQDGYDEFWNDTYLMWELLYDKEGYTNENITVLFNQGNDYNFNGMDGRYKSITLHDIQSITDYSSTKANIQQVFANLASTVTDDDFVYIWIMSHGGNTNPQGNGHSYVYLSGYNPANPDAGRLYDYELEAMLQSILAHKIVVNIQAPYSGGFATQWQGDENTVIFTSSDKDESSSRADDLPEPGNAPVIENEIINGITYHHGEYGFHFYSELNGADPTGNTVYGNYTFEDGNNNQDHVISIYEAWLWNHVHNTSGETVVISGNGMYVSFNITLKYPTIIADNMTSNQNYKGIIGITGPPPQGTNWRRVEMVGNITINFEENSNVYFFPDMKFINDVGIINIGDNVVIKGDSTTSYIYSESEVNFGQNVLFTGTDDVSDPTLYGWFGGLISVLNDIDIDNVAFYKAIGHTFSGSNINITNSSFTRSAVYCQANYGDININNCQFIQSGFLAGAVDYPAIQVLNSIFEGPTDIGTSFWENMGINIAGYGQFLIEDNSISNYDIGISIGYSGNDLAPDGYSIKNNVISNNSAFGVAAHHSHVLIYDGNIINNNSWGIVSSDHANMRIWGNENADITSETQQINDNDINQIWASDEAFPYLRWNAIWDNDNTDCLVYWNLKEYDQSADVRYNYWGGTYFDPNEDLCPVENFIWEPVWHLKMTIQTISTAEQLYQDVVALTDSNDFSGARVLCQQIISDFPESKFAGFALRDLLDIEAKVNNDYAALKAYYLTEPTILSDSVLKESADWLSNWCNVYQENYQEALNYLYEVINNPMSYQDSVNALLDLDYISTLQENSSRSFNQSRSNQEAIEKTDLLYANKNRFHLGLLINNGNKISESTLKNIEQLKGGELINNYPNPFSGITHIWYKIEEASNINILIYNSIGIRVSTIIEGYKTGGNHEVVLEGSDLPVGIYFYSLQVNGQISDTRKMSIMR